ncbi:MAG: glycosyltransferase family 4 protein [Clostridiales Family XIII bacterium]|nr:glycosyltransferase family 4 protein [Clostridiales Family XIII bacterium]
MGGIAYPLTINDMKIILVSFSKLPPFQNYMYNLARQLTKMNIEVRTVGAIPHSAIHVDETNYILDVHDSPNPSFKSLKKYLKIQKSLCVHFDKASPAHVVFISKHFWNYLLIRKLNKNIKKYHVFHDPIGHKGDIIRFGVILYNRLIAKKVDKIFVHSNNAFHDTIKYIKPDVPVIKIPLGEEEWLELNQENHIFNKLLIFGRINNYKGYEFIPQLADALKSELPEVRIVVAGKSSKDVNRQILQDIANKDNVKFTDEFIPEDKMHDYFDTCDAVIVLHTSITQSGVIINAYRHTKGIICFKIDGIEEFIDEHSSISVDAFDIQAMCKSIKRAYNDKVFYMLGRNAWHLGQEIFSIEKMAEGYFENIRLLPMGCE